MEQNKQYIEEDEIDLREVWKTIVKRKWFIIIFTSIVTIIALIYTYTKNPTPIYSGNMMIEIGEVRSEGTNLETIDNVNNLKNILEKKYSVSVTVPKRTNNLIVISSSNEDKKLIKDNILSSLDFIIKRHQLKIELFDKYIMTKQLGKLTISNTPINIPKKKLIVTVAFVTGFILSIFLVFFMQFVQGFKEEKDK